MKLDPLTQFVCDTCGDVIESPKEGWLEWLSSAGKGAHGFRIVHHVGTSGNRCARYGDRSDVADGHLGWFTGERAMPELLRFIDVGPLLEDEYRGPRVKDLREWVELTRRLTIPHYEEARLYWDQAREDGMFDGANEVSPYLPEKLEQIAKRYRTE